MRNCKLCVLSETRTQVVVGDYGKLPVVFIGEGPGFNEDKQGKPFVGRSGKLLDEMLEMVGLSRTEISVFNIVKCRPPENRTPTSSEMRICGDMWLQKQLDFLKPRFVVPLGNTSLKYFLPKGQITRDNAKMHQFLAYHIFPLFHPSYILRQGGDKNGEYLTSFQQMKKEFDGVRTYDQDTKDSDLENFFT